MFIFIIIFLILNFGKIHLITHYLWKIQNQNLIKKEIFQINFMQKELNRFKLSLVKLQEWIKHKELKVVVIFEGRDAAGKGGTIKRIIQTLNPRICRVLRLERQQKGKKRNGIFNVMSAHFPAAGEMVLFDRSWYNRAGVEKVMGFCTNDEYWEFLRSCPNFERMLIRSGIILIKYWFSVSEKVQEKRFLCPN